MNTNNPLIGFAVIVTFFTILAFALAIKTGIYG